MSRTYNRRAIDSRLIAALSGVALISVFGGLSACSKTDTTKTEEATSSVASDAAAAVSDAGSMVADAVTPDTPQDFATKAGIANTFEIDSSKLALTMATRADVKAFAQKMITDHTKAGKAYKAALAKTTGVTAPVALDDASQAKLDDLKKKTKGDDFDNAYIDAQKSAHSDAVSLFDSYAKNGTDSALKDFAATTLPTLQGHKDMIDKM